MMLPKKVGSFTLMRKLDADGITESFVAILDDPPGKQVVARRIVPSIARDPERMASIVARVAELEAVRHPCLAPVLGLVYAEGDPYVLEDWTDGVPLRGLIDACQTRGLSPPANVYLHLATQLSNALEVLHTARDPASEAGPLLHFGLSPSSIVIGADGRVTIARYGLVKAPLTAPGEDRVRVAYLAPEQTHPEPVLDPASDIFALGVVLYEMSTLEPLFDTSSPERTIEQIRRAEITLTDVRDRVPGLDQVLLRALSVHPRHRYQRAFVVREDLRGLMAGYTFTEIDQMAREFLAPLVRGRRDRSVDDLVPPPYLPAGGSIDALLGGTGVPDPADADTQLDPGPGLDQAVTLLENDLAQTPVGAPEHVASYHFDHEAPTVVQQGRPDPPTFPLRARSDRAQPRSAPVPTTWAPWAVAGAAFAALMLLFMCAGIATSLLVWNSGRAT